MSRMSIITAGIIKQLVKIGRLCVVESGKVYDVTEFAERHPGGADKVATNAGKDITEILKDVKSHKHSSSAYSILKQYYIGEYEIQPKCRGRSQVILAPNQAKVLNNNDRNCMFEDDMVDWSKPLMPQVASLKEKYFDWVHRPVDRQIRLFKSDLVEYFSMCSWYIVPMVWVPVMAFFAWISYNRLSSGQCVFRTPLGTEYQLSESHLSLFMVIGATCWTLAEYLIHRWIFHLRPPSNWPILIQFHFLMHGNHHKSPMDKRRLVFPPVPASGLGFMIYLVYSSLVVDGVCFGLMSGTVMGYLMYDLTHYYLHHGVPYSSYFKELKRYHVMHHYVDQQNGFGISSKLWDYPFGTLIRDKEE